MEPSKLINPERLLKNLHALRDFGRFGTGVHRPTYSPEDVAARSWLTERMAEANLDGTIDGIGNVLGFTRNRGRVLLVGSHTDTQPQGGWLDGALGVIYGLELALSFPDLPIDVVSWADEEAHFGSFIGSRSFIGTLSEEEIDNLRDREDGTPLRVALERAGYAGRERLRGDPSRYLGYLEAHIEQGDVLDKAGLHLGIVTGIVGIWQYRLVCEGQQNHAGTTRMSSRRDAGAAAVSLIQALNERFAAVAGEATVWTVGQIKLMPGAHSVIPGRAEILFQFRDESPALLDELQTLMNETVAELDAAGPCRIGVECLAQSQPKTMSEPFVEVLHAAGRAIASDNRVIRMPSGAGHDAQIINQMMPSAMLFVPSINGISHHVDEDTKEEDIVRGCAALAEAARRILSGDAAAVPR